MTTDTKHRRTPSAEPAADTGAGLKIERTDEHIAVLTLTRPLDAAAVATVRGALSALTVEGRRYVALDLSAVHESTGGGTNAGIKDLAHQAAQLRAEGGELFLISPPSDLSDTVKARAFKSRAFWDRYGGINATPKPHPIRYATEAQVLRDADTFYGVPIIGTGEDGEWAFTLGHHEPRRFLAAMLAYVRTVQGCDPGDAGLDSIDSLTGLGEKARDWSVIYTHAGRDTLGTQTPGDDTPADWCVCDEGSWYAADAAEGAPHAVPTMTYWIGG